MKNAAVDGETGARKKTTISDLYRHSDLSVEAIAQQVDVDVSIVQNVVDGLLKNEVLDVLIHQSMTGVDKVMTPTVITLDSSRTVREAAALMAENAIGSVIVTKNDRPYGIITQSDIVKLASIKQAHLDAKLEDPASRPLITVQRSTAVEEAARVMIENEIHKLPVVDDKGELLGILTITDLAVFLSPSRRPGLALSVLQAISRGRG